MQVRVLLALFWFLVGFHPSAVLKAKGRGKGSHGEVSGKEIELGGRGGSSRMGLAPLGSLSKREYLNETGPDPGLSSADGSMKHITLYHGSFSDFDSFDYEAGKAGKSSGADMYGEGFYLTSDPEAARAYGDRIYTVDVAYSTNRRVAKRTGREQDFSYNPDTGYWVIPKDKANNLKIKGKKRVN